MDVLSEVLSAIRLEGALFFNAEFSAPWRVSSTGAAGIEPYLQTKSAHVIVYHYLTEGKAYAEVENGQRVELAVGDIVIFPHGDSHTIGNGSVRSAVDSYRDFAKHLAGGLKAVRFGGGGEVTRFVCGYMACDPRLCEVLLLGLPRIFKVPVGNGSWGQWIENSIRFSAGELTDLDPGSSLVVGKLSEVLFVETLRRYIATLSPEQTGWFAGLRDPLVAKALAALHRDPAKAWTVDGLAKDAGSSRTRLAAKFQHFLGMSPIAYLTEWRMKLAAEALKSTQKSVVEVALDVGYGSEAAFNRAFKRVFEMPPAQFRQNRKSGNGATRDKGKEGQDDAGTMSRPDASNCS